MLPEQTRQELERWHTIMLNEVVAAFLRRTDKIDLRAAAVREEEESFASTFAEASSRLSDLIRHAAEATGR